MGPLDRWACAHLADGDRAINVVYRRAVQLRLGRYVRLRRVELFRGIRLWLATLRSGELLDAIYERPVGLLSSTGLDVGERGAVGLDALSLWKLELPAIEWLDVVSIGL